MIRTKHSKNSFPLTKLPHDIIENIISISIKNTSTTLTGSNLIYVNRLFARISIPYIWKHLYLIEPEERIIFNILSKSPEELMFDYKSFVRKITICPISISNMSSGGLLKILEILQNLFEQHHYFIGISIQDKLDVCHLCHIGKEVTFDQLSKKLLSWKGLSELSLNSNHSAFNDNLLGELLPNYIPFIDKQKGIIYNGLRKISLNGKNFTDKGILQHVIPYVKDSLIEFNAGHSVMNDDDDDDDGDDDYSMDDMNDDPTDNITGFSILELLKNCKKLERVYLEGIALNDSDFIIKLPNSGMTLNDDDDNIDEIYCDELLDDNLSDFDLNEYDSTNSSANNSLIIVPHPSQEISSQLKHLYIGKLVDKSKFTHDGLSSLLSFCHKSLLTLEVDLDHISESVLLDVFIPLFSDTKLQEIHLTSASWLEWATYYPRPRKEFDIQAKEAMWRWRLKSYWGLSKELVERVGDKIESLKVFSILGENYLDKSKSKSISK